MELEIATLGISGRASPFRRLPFGFTYGLVNPQLPTSDPLRWSRATPRRIMVVCVIVDVSNLMLCSEGFTIVSQAGTHIVVLNPVVRRTPAASLKLYWKVVPADSIPSVTIATLHGDLRSADGDWDVV